MVDRRRPFAQSPFFRHLDRLGLTGDPTRSPEKILRRRWLKPRLTVDAPPLSRKPATEEAESPAAEAAPIDAFCETCQGIQFNKFEGHWWLADLDRVSDPFIAEIRAAQLEADPSDPFTAAASSPWNADRVEFYRSTDAYLIAGLQHRCFLPSDPLASDDADPAQLLHHQQARQADRARRTHEEWASRDAVFDRVSLHRTAYSIFRFPEMEPMRGAMERHWEQAEADLLQRCPRTPQQWEEDIRQAFLRPWERWRLMLPGGPLTNPKLVQSFRTDLWYAFQLAEAAGMSRIDPLAEPWDCGRPWHTGQSRGRRPEARLLEVLPREEEVAVVEFPQRVLPYTKSLDHLPWKSLDATALFRLVAAVREQPVIDRFLLSFLRLHEGLDPNRLPRLGDNLPARVLIGNFNQLLLDLEKALVAWSLGAAANPPPQQPDLRACMKQLLDAFLSRRGTAPGPAASIKGRLTALLRGRTGDEAHHTKDLPLVDLPDVPRPDDETREFLLCLVNFFVGRNHAAHSTSVDYRLVHVAHGEKPENHLGGRILTATICVFLELCHSHGGPLPAGTPGPEAPADTVG